MSEFLREMFNSSLEVPDVSVVIPVHNNEEDLERSIGSLLEQTFDNFELIVVENGSTDGSYRLLRRLLSSQKRISWQLIRIDEPDVSRARNIGISLSKGDYLYFMDADDRVEKTLLEDLIHKAKKHRLDFAFCGFDRINEKKGVVLKYARFFKYPKKIINGSKAAYLYLIGKIWPVIGSFVVKNNLVKNNNILFKEKVFAGEDQIFILESLIKSRRVGAVRRSMLYYYVKPQSLSKSNRVFQSIETFEKLLIDLNKEKEYVDRKILSAIRSYKIPYLTLRAMFRYAHGSCYKEFLELRNICMNRVKMNFVFPMSRQQLLYDVGVILLRFFPYLFYRLSRLQKI